MEDLIIYSSTDGQTKKICETIKAHISSNNNFKIISLNEALNLNLEKCKKIILGASIRYGRHNKNVLNFVIKNKNILNSKKTAFFSVNVVARKKEKSTPSCALKSSNHRRKVEALYPEELLDKRFFEKRLPVK